MNEIANITNGTALTMSSLEIAGLTGKQHAHVMRDIRVMLDSLGGQSKFGSTYLDAQGKTRECCLLPKRETMILVSGYSIELRARIIDRWMELEAAIASATSTSSVVTDIDAATRNTLGGMIKRNAGVVVREELAPVLSTIEDMQRAILSIAAIVSPPNPGLYIQGKTSGEIWTSAGLPKIKNGARWLGNRLSEMGCQIDDCRVARLGMRGARLFDPDKAAACMRNGLLHKAKVYASERMGQGRLRLIGGEGEQ